MIKHIVAVCLIIGCLCATQKKNAEEITVTSTEEPLKYNCGIWDTTTDFMAGLNDTHIFRTTDFVLINEGKELLTIDGIGNYNDSAKNLDTIVIRASQEPIVKRDSTGWIIRFKPIGR